MRPCAVPDSADLSSVTGGRPATAEELWQIQREIGVAAGRAVAAGFDAVQLQALCGNLLSQFLSPLTNHRTDEYGGSLRNRARMLVECLASIRRVVDDNVPVLCRVNGDDLMDGGMGPADYQELVPMLEKAGVDAIDVKPGWFESRHPVNQMSVPRGAFAYVSAALKRVARVPVSANTRITDPELAEALLERGDADYIALGTPLVADPEWPRKAAEGRFDDIRPCTACCECWSDLAGSHVPIACSVNAHAGREHEIALTRATTPKTIWVIGGGPAGMEAARVAATRGHLVTLFERDRTLGGGLRLAAIPPHTQEWEAFRVYLVAQLEKLNVAVRTGAEVAAADILAGRPDVVVLATGGQPARPTVPGSEQEHVRSSVDVLDGVPTGRRVIVTGSGRDGCEVAEFLRAQGRTVTLVSDDAELASDEGVWSRWVLLDRLAGADIRVLAPGRLEAITASQVRVTTQGRDHTIPADTVVFAMGFEPEVRLHHALAGRVRELHVLESPDRTPTIRWAVLTGFLCGLRV